MGIDYDGARVLPVLRLTNHTIQWPGDTQDQTGLGAQYLYIIILCVVYYTVIPTGSYIAHLRSITSARAGEAVQLRVLYRFVVCPSQYVNITI